MRVYLRLLNVDFEKLKGTRVYRIRYANVLPNAIEMGDYASSVCLSL